MSREQLELWLKAIGEFEKERGELFLEAIKNNPEAILAMLMGRYTIAKKKK